jgi:hypothetical protein
LSVPDSQWCDFLTEPELAPAVGPALVKHLLSNAREWDQLCLDKLPADSAARSWIAPAFAERNAPVHFEAVDSNPFIELNVPWCDYLSALPRGIKKTRNLAATGCRVLELPRSNGNVPDGEPS